VAVLHVKPIWVSMMHAIDTQITLLCPALPVHHMPSHCVIGTQAMRWGALALLSPFQSDQNTGASFKNSRSSSFFTQRATAFAAPTTALFGSSGDSATYNSNGCVICDDPKSTQVLQSRDTTYPAHDALLLRPYILQLQRSFLPRLAMNRIVHDLIQRDNPVGNTVSAEPKKKSRNPTSVSH
jgi:hypothetical protein